MIIFAIFHWLTGGEALVTNDWPDLSRTNIHVWLAKECMMNKRVVWVLNKAKYFCCNFVARYSSCHKDHILLVFRYLYTVIDFSLRDCWIYFPKTTCRIKAHFFFFWGGGWGGGGEHIAEEPFYCTVTRHWPAEAPLCPWDVSHLQRGLVVYFLPTETGMRFQNVLHQ